ncbi:MAG: tRNA threonylcarbamoyladenosine dehydratase [Candidatus Cloacimonetes bacterium]|nr:tRNA threonylcarbamoyladenosine dehydratase [Candidatus Cloacimonadota bacterium]
MSYSEIFQRTELMYGSSAMRALQKLRVGIFGLGGVGSYATETLARCGVGNFLLVDFDVIKKSNINRQIIALHSTLGKLKTEVTRSRILDINPEAGVEIFNGFCADETRDDLLKNIDIVVDCIDSLNPKVNLLQHAFELSKPIISVMGAAGRSKPEYIRTDDLAKTNACPLARRVRRYLSRRGISKGIPIVFSTEPPLPSIPPSESSEEEQVSTRGRIRNTQASNAIIPAIMGITAAAWVVNTITRQYE